MNVTLYKNDARTEAPSAGESLVWQLDPISRLYLYEDKNTNG